jgi:hypothetical protein
VCVVCACVCDHMSERTRACVQSFVHVCAYVLLEGGERV